MLDSAFAWVAALVTAPQPVILKMTSKSLVKDPWIFNILWVTFGAPPALLLGKLFGGGLPVDWTPIAAIALCHALFFSLFSAALFKIDVSTMSPLFSFRTLFAVLIGVLVLDESFGWLSMALIAVIVIVSPLAAYDPELKLTAFFRPPVLVAILAMLALALGGYYTNVSSEVNGYATTLMWQDLLTLVVLLPTVFLADREHRQLSRTSLIPFLLLGLSSFLYTASATEAYRRNLSLSSIIISLPLSMILTVVLARRWAHLLEDHGRNVYIVRFTAALIMTAAAIVLSLTTT